MRRKKKEPKKIGTSPISNPNPFFHLGLIAPPIWKCLVFDGISIMVT